MMGVYKFTNVVTGKVYVGSSYNIARRYQDHFNGLLKNKSPLTRVQNSFNKHGFANFYFSILEIVDKSEELLKREQYWIDFYDSTHQDKGYNIRKIPNSNKGFKQSLETKERISKALIGRVCSEETKKKIGNSVRGGKRSEECRKKMSMAKLGKPSSRRKRVAKCKDNGSIIVSYPSILEASIKEKSSRNIILNCLKGRRKSLKDFNWIYLD